VSTTAAGTFSSQLAPGTWQITPHYQGGGDGGIDAGDVATVLDVSVGMASMPSGMAVAADVSGNGYISAYDAALILQRAQGNNQPFPASLACGSDWAFIPAPANVPNQSITLPALSDNGCIQGAVGYQPLAGNAAEQNFLAVLFGNADASGQAAP
jgi:hypothetical protein